LGALIKSEAEEGIGDKMVVNSILEDADAFRRGLDLGDELVSFAGRPMTTVNQFKNVLGLFPKGWRVPLVFRRENDRREILVRLMGVLPQEQAEGERRPPGPPGPAPEAPKPPAPDSPAAKPFQPNPGFA